MARIVITLPGGDYALDENTDLNAIVNGIAKATQVVKLAGSYVIDDNPRPALQVTVRPDYEFFEPSKRLDAVSKTAAQGGRK